MSNKKYIIRIKIQTKFLSFIYDFNIERVMKTIIYFK